jgi:hypothetical protein
MKNTIISYMKIALTDGWFHENGKVQEGELARDAAAIYWGLTNEPSYPKLYDECAKEAAMWFIINFDI